VERIKSYIMSRKLVTLDQIMDRFMVSQATAYKAVNSLLSEGKIRRYVKNRKRYYRPNHSPNIGSGHQSIRKEMLLQLPDLEELRSRLNSNL
jgi:DeoR/GlpR family transcriptional regulator of sugar metabolism